MPYFSSTLSLMDPSLVCPTYIQISFYLFLNLLQSGSMVLMLMLLPVRSSNLVIVKFPGHLLVFNLLNCSPSFGHCWSLFSYEVTILLASGTPLITGSYIFSVSYIFLLSHLHGLLFLSLKMLMLPVFHPWLAALFTIYFSLVFKITSNSVSLAQSIPLKITCATISSCLLAIFTWGMYVSYPKHVSYWTWFLYP